MYMNNVLVKTLFLDKLSMYDGRQKASPSIITSITENI